MEAVKNTDEGLKIIGEAVSRITDHVAKKDQGVEGNIELPTVVEADQNMDKEEPLENIHSCSFVCLNHCGLFDVPLHALILLGGMVYDAAHRFSDYFLAFICVFQSFHQPLPASLRMAPGRAVAFECFTPWTVFCPAEGLQIILRNPQPPRHRAVCWRRLWHLIGINGALVKRYLWVLIRRPIYFPRYTNNILNCL